MPCVSVKHIRDSRATLKATKSQLALQATTPKSNARASLFARLRQALKSFTFKKNPATQAASAANHAPSAPVQAPAHPTKIAEGYIKIPHDNVRRIVPAPATTHSTAPASYPPTPLATSNTTTAPRRSDRLAALTALRFNRRSRADLINAESRLGSQIFGPIPEGHRREFFHDRENIWIWHEDWTDQAAQPRQLTVRYEVRPSGVYKKISAGNYFRLEGYELENFRRAAHLYLALIKTHLYPQVTTNT